MRAKPGTGAVAAGVGGPVRQTVNPAVVYAAAAQVLAYPSAELLGRLPLLRAALGFAEDPAPGRGAVPDPVDGFGGRPASSVPASSGFGPILDHLAGNALLDLQRFHVAEFDTSRRHALHLTYWTDGDTRRRGESLLAFKQAYRDSGLVVDLDGELPDYLPMVCEFAVRDDVRGRDLLIRYRTSLELLRLQLLDDGLPHAGVLAAICATLPGRSPRTRTEVGALHGAVMPFETVGLDPYDPRLLPLQGS